MALTVGLVRPLAQLQSSGTPTIYNVTVSLANTEYSQAVTSAKQILIRVRNGSGLLKVAFQSGNSGTVYVTLPKGTTYVADNLDFTGNIYFQSPSSAQTVEILAWS